MKKSQPVSRITRALVQCVLFISFLSFFQSCCSLSLGLGSCTIRKSDLAKVENQSPAITNNTETKSAELFKSAVEMAAQTLPENSRNKTEGLVNTSLQKPRAALPFGIKSIGTSLTAGPNLSFKSSKEDYGSSNHKHSPGAGFQVGVGSIIKFTDKVAFTPSILFKQNNASEKLTYSAGGMGPSYSSEAKYKYNWISTPLLLNYQATEKLSIKAGPELNFLVKASAKTTEESETRKEDITDQSQKLGIGAQVGLSYNLSEDGAWMLSLLYDHRISRLNKKDGGTGGNYEVPGWYMRSVQLGITCAICNLLGRK